MNALTTPTQIEAFKLCVLKSGLKLEIMGMKRSGRSCYAMAKDKGFKGNKQAVFAQLVARIEAMQDEIRTQAYEAEGMTRSDAQACVEAEKLTQG